MEKLKKGKIIMSEALWFLYTHRVRVGTMLFIFFAAMLLVGPPESVHCQFDIWSHYFVTLFFSILTGVYYLYPFIKEFVDEV